MDKYTFFCLNRGASAFPSFDELAKRVALRVPWRCAQEHGHGRDTNNARSSQITWCAFPTIKPTEQNCLRWQQPLTATLLLNISSEVTYLGSAGPGARWTGLKVSGIDQCVGTMGGVHLRHSYQVSFSLTIVDRTQAKCHHAAAATGLTREALEWWPAAAAADLERRGLL